MILQCHGGSPCNLRSIGGANSKRQNGNSSFLFPTFHLPFHLLTALWMETDCSYSEEFNLLARRSITEALRDTATAISVHRYQHQLISQTKPVNRKKIARDTGCYRPRPNVVFWRCKDLYTITDLLSFPVPGVHFHGKKNLFQIMPDISALPSSYT